MFYNILNNAAKKLLVKTHFRVTASEIIQIKVSSIEYLLSYPTLPLNWEKISSQAMKIRVASSSTAFLYPLIYLMKDAKSRLRQKILPRFPYIVSYTMLYIIAWWFENIIHLYKLLANCSEIPFRDFVFNLGANWWKKAQLSYLGIVCVILWSQIIKGENIIICQL